MQVGLYDDPKTMRRSMWVKSPKGKPLCFGWCHASELPGAADHWEPQTPFGHFPAK